MPALAFLLTATAEGKPTNQKEMDKFGAALLTAESMGHTNELANEVFMSLSTHLSAVLVGGLRQLADDKGMDMLAELQSAGRIVDSKCPVDAEGLKRAVLLICYDLELASGGGKISEFKSAAFELIGKALGTTLGQSGR